MIGDTSGNSGQRDLLLRGGINPESACFKGRELLQIINLFCYVRSLFFQITTHRVSKAIMHNPMRTIGVTGHITSSQLMLALSPRFNP